MTKEIIIEGLGVLFKWAGAMTPYIIIVLLLGTVSIELLWRYKRKQKRLEKLRAKRVESNSKKFN